MFHPEKCVGCKECLKACPMKPKDFSIFACKQECDDCLKSCPYGALEIRAGIIVWDPDKCTFCGKCACKYNALPPKCDQCINFDFPKCVEVCPYKALEIEYSEEEKRLFKEYLGYIDYERPITGLDVKIIAKMLDLFWNKNIHPEESIYLIEKVNGLKLSKRKKERLVNIALWETKYSFLTPILEENVEEIAVVGEKVYVYEIGKGWRKKDMYVFPEKVITLANKIGMNIGRRITYTNPSINASFEKGRMHAAIPPLSETPTLTIRKFGSHLWDKSKYLSTGIITKEAFEFLEALLKGDSNILICGNTGSGKTTLLNTLLNTLDPSERIIIVEETPEIFIPHPHTVRFITKDMVNVIHQTLRMRPDRIVIGEIRQNREIEAFIHCLLAGQGKGVIATFHAEHVEEVFKRFERFDVEKRFLNTLDCIVVMKRWTERGKEKRAVLGIYDAHGNAIFEYKKGKLIPATIPSKIKEKVEKSGIKLETLY